MGMMLRLQDTGQCKKPAGQTCVQCLHQSGGPVQYLPVPFSPLPL